MGTVSDVESRLPSMAGIPMSWLLLSVPNLTVNALRPACNMSSLAASRTPGHVWGCIRDLSFDAVGECSAGECERDDDMSVYHATHDMSSVYVLLVTTDRHECASAATNVQRACAASHACLAC